MRRKKYLLTCFLAVLFILSVPFPCEAAVRRGLFVSLIQDPPVLSSRQEIVRLIDFAKNARVRVLFVQIYRENKAWFPSRIADAGPYAACLKNDLEDPFALLIRQAHASGIQVHAWLNMLSLSQNEDARILKKYGTSVLTKNLKPKKTLRDYRIDDQYFLEPGDPRVRRELSGIVGEILRGYPDLDGIEYDYLRYPDKDPFYGYTKINIERFKKSTGCRTVRESDPLWKKWRRDQVTEFLKLLVQTARAIRPDIQISATGCAPYERAFYEAFQDWPSWIKTNLVDFVTVMSYSSDMAEFKKFVSEAQSKAADLKKLNIAVGAYKLVNQPEVFRSQFAFCEKSHCGGCVIFHYGSLLQNDALAGPLLSRRS